MPAVSPELKKQLLALKIEDCTVPFLISKISKTTRVRRDQFGARSGFQIKPAEWNLQATMRLNPGEYINEKAVDTTLGSFLFNKLLIEDKVSAVWENGYFNEVANKKNIGKLINAISTGLTERKIKLMPNVTGFIQSFEFYGLMLAPALASSLSPALLSVQDDLREERDKLFSEMGENPSIQQVVEAEDKLVKMAADKLKNDPAMSLFTSGARGSFDDNYKMMSLTIGPVYNNSTGEYDVIKSNYIDGIQKRDLPAMGNVVVNAAYPKAVGTADGGYITKQFYSVFQSISLDEKGTNCGSKGYLTVYMTGENYADYMYQYAVVNGKMVLMTHDNKSEFVNKIVQMRSPIGCRSSKICNACMGERYYMLGIQNAGLTAGRLPNSILNAGMKAFHATKVHLNSVNLDTLVI